MPLAPPGQKQTKKVKLLHVPIVALDFTNIKPARLPATHVAPGCIKINNAKRPAKNVLPGCIKINDANRPAKNVDVVLIPTPLAKQNASIADPAI